MSDIPRRAVMLTIKLEADTRQAMASALFDIGDQISRGELSTGVCGGYDSSYIYEYVEGNTPTHSEYAEQLRTYLREKKAAGGKS